jgi:hypothetical protein
MSLKIENLRRVAKSRPVCMGLHTRNIFSTKSLQPSQIFPIRSCRQRGHSLRVSDVLGSYLGLEFFTGRILLVGKPS